MNILLAFKAEPDAGMLAEKEWQAAAQGNSGPDVSLLRSLLGADEQAAAAADADVLHRFGKGLLRRVQKAGKGLGSGQ